MKFVPQALVTLCILLAAEPLSLLAQNQPPNATSTLPRTSPAQASAERELMLLQQAAEHGDPVAQVALGDARAYARGPFKNYVEAVKWYRLAAEQGFAPAQTRLGGCLLQGDGGKRDPVEAYAWFQKAAAQEDIVSIHMIGRFREEGWGNVATNYAEAVRWYLKSAAYGQIHSMIQLGKLHAAGRGVPKDTVEAMKWFYLVDQRRAAETNRFEPPPDYDATRRAIMDNMKMAETAEAKRRAALFVFTPRPATNYEITYWKTNTPPPPPSDTAISPPVSLAAPSQAVPASRTAANMVIDVPLQIEEDRPYVTARINGSKTMRLLFDSGGGISLVREKVAAKLKLKPTGQVMVNGVNMDVMKGATIELGAASFSPPMLGLESRDTLQIKDRHGDGIVGADLLQKFVVELDYRNNRMRLHDPLRYKYTGPGDYLLLRFDLGRPYLDAKLFDGLGRTTTARYLIDTGATSALYLERDFWQAKGIKESIGRAQVGTAVSIEGEQRVSMGELNGIQIGHYYVPRPKTVFMESTGGSQSLAGIIGGDILRRFTIVFHYGRQQLIFIPNGTPVQPTAMTDSASVLNK